MDQKRGAVNLADAIQRSQDSLLSIQYPEGYWVGELEGNVTGTAEAVLLHKVWGSETAELLPTQKIENYLRAQQRSHGGWELFHGDGGELSMSVEAYMALRLLNVPTSDPALQKARQFILERGGISKTRIFTKLNLAIIGCYDWRGIPSIPAWAMLLPAWFPTNIYEMSSWTRSCFVPLLIVFDRKPVFVTDPAITLDELFVEEEDNNARFDLPRHGDWTDWLVTLDGVFKLAEKYHLVPFRERGLKAAEQWVLEHQEQVSGAWHDIFFISFNSLLSLRVLDYSVFDPVVQRALEALHKFWYIETEDQLWVQQCCSTVWDTAFVMRSLVDSGLSPTHPSLQRGGEWLLQKQILCPGDWMVKNKRGKAGGWAFEFYNLWFPDLDDTAAVVMALTAVQLRNEPIKQAAIARAINWISSMQCTAGGWAAFDIDNNQSWLNCTPYGDLKAMIDPNTADVTARVLEMVGRLQTQTQNLLISTPAINRALAYLRKEQEPEGCWFGRWGVNYIYGTSGVLIALSLVAPKAHEQEIARGARWLVESQKKNKDADGGWGETCRSYNDASLKGHGEHSTASQTAWAILGLLAAGEALGKYEIEAMEKGIQFLLNTQRPDGTWNEPYFTGTGFPCEFYFKYELYSQHFPLTALARYRAFLQKHTSKIPCGGA